MTKRSKLDNSDISIRNGGKLDYIKKTLQLAKNLQEDPQKQERIKNCTCLVCWYRSGGMHTNSFVHTNCKSCNKDLQFVNSNTDEVCIDCAKEHKLCKHCGADIEYKERRKQRIFNFKEVIND
ncbi:MAG: hypothetical protein FJ368_07055 [Pelagibacterales bacterium]|nr:hypothetical protein [Pelagibacterales bacterium]